MQSRSVEDGIRPVCDRSDTGARGSSTWLQLPSIHDLELPPPRPLPAQWSRIGRPQPPPPLHCPSPRLHYPPSILQFPPPPPHDHSWPSPLHSTPPSLHCTPSPPQLTSPPRPLQSNESNKHRNSTSLSEESELPRIEVDSSDGETQPRRPKQKRRRDALSCTECKRRKIKCDRLFPCGACLKREEQINCRFKKPEEIPSNDLILERLISVENQLAEVGNLKRRLAVLEAAEHANSVIQFTPVSTGWDSHSAPGPLRRTPTDSSASLFTPAYYHNMTGPPTLTDPSFSQLHTETSSFHLMTSGCV